ncbi:MAG: alpha-E domain-containing protein [Pseudomonadota bacterium]
MLSRAAERVYWTGRYLERAENTARIVQQYSQQLLDMPEEAGLAWEELIRIVGASAEFAGRTDAANEQTVLNFLLAEPTSPVSVAWSLRCARDNLRNTRDLLPMEAWESANELYIFAAQALTRAVSSDARFEVLDEVIRRCQQLNGVFDGTMSHNTPFRFLRLGQHLERADMTSRLVDVAAAYMQHNADIVKRHGSSLWSNVLKSVSGLQMYRQCRQPQVVGRDVVEFLVLDTGFPRAIARCLARARYNTALLPRPADTLAAIDKAGAALPAIPEGYSDAAFVTGELDALQKHFTNVHSAIADTWFLPRVSS